MNLLFDKNLIAKGEKIAVAFSGGKDSSALLFALNNYLKEFDFTLKAINVEHGIRDKESVRDSEFCKSVCENVGIELKSYRVDAPNFSKTNKLSLEEGARKLRYDCFYDAINQGFCDKVATAHHLSDQAETVLFNLFRGSSLSGLSGIASISDDNRLIRPLINTKQEEIINYVNYYDIPFVSDSTNSELNYTRNYLRKKVLPTITEKFNNAQENICNLATLARFDDEYLYSLAKKEIISDGESKKVFFDLSFSIFTRAIKLIFNDLGIKKDYTKKHFDACYALRTNSTGAKAVLPNKVVAIREYDYIVFRKLTAQKNFDAPFNLTDFENENFKITFEKINASAYANCKKTAYSAINERNLLNNTLYCDYAFFKDSRIRNVTDGLLFEKFGGGSKTVNKYLIDKKIPSYKRRNVLIITASDGYVLAVCGVEISNRVKITKNTKEILKITTIQKR